MKVGTLNVNDFVASAAKRAHILNVISKEKLDIICLQETDLTDNDNISDHHLEWGSFDLDKHDRGPGLWSLNNSILKDRTYTKLIKDFWEEWKTIKNKYKDILFWWDLGKNK